MLRPELDTLPISDQRNRAKFLEYLNITLIAPSVSTISISLKFGKTVKKTEPRKYFYNSLYSVKNVIM